MHAKKENEIFISRLYDAPVKLVWEAWTDDKKVAKWWGPRGFTITTHSKDLKVGGHWSYTMHGPDGTDYVNKTKYHVVEPYKKLVYDHGGNEDIDRAPLFRVTVTFEEKNGKTKMDMTMALATAEAAKETKKFIKKAGGNATWDRLAEFLGEQEGQHPFYINRSFEAPIATVFKMWTDPMHVSKWMPPTGFTMEYMKADIRPGGSSFYKMTNGKDVTMYGSAHYIEISPVTKLVYAQDFRDKDGNISRHPMAPLWPEAMLTTVTFAEEGPNETRVTVQWKPHGKCTQEEIDVFMNARAGMTMGWTGSFDKLEEYLTDK
ncbi:MAG: SRPBCC family protein [Bacteriovoracaceae bacterium]